MSLCSEVRTWSSCTGVAVRVTLIVSPVSSFGADGEPGLRSTKKLPSRKMRGRILAVASSWIGSPASLTSMTTSVWSVPSRGLIDLILPTLTPAIRTGELTRSPLDDSKTALTRKPLVNGMSFVKPRKSATAAIASAISPIVRGLRCLRRRRATAAAITWCPP